MTSIILENTHNNKSCITSIIMCLFYISSSFDKMLSTSVNSNSVIYLQEYLVCTINKKIRANKSLTLNNINTLYDIICESGFNFSNYENNVIDVFNFFISKLKYDGTYIRYVQKNINTFTKEIAYMPINLLNNNSPTIKNIFNTFTTDCQFLNFPEHICFYINRFELLKINRTFVNISKQISYSYNNDILHTKTWRFCSLICHTGDSIQNGHYYSIIYKHTSNLFYVCDDMIIPSLIKIDLKDEFVRKKIESECVFIIYSL